ncbi:MAG: hypothetical protein ILA24_06455 [Ruminococcus sp.]|nr:hypothetical protein [Ruminococcus sp.]
MNDKMLDIIGLADEKYLHEAEGKPVMKQTKHRRKLSAKVVAVAAAAAVMTVTAGAVAVAKLSNKESVELYYNDKMASDIEFQGYAVNQVTENKNIRMTLENLMITNYYATGIVTVEALDDVGEYALSSSPIVYPFDSSGKCLEEKDDTSIDAFFLLDEKGGKNSNRKKLALQLQIIMRDSKNKKRNELPEKIKIAFMKDTHSNFDVYSIRTIDQLANDEFEGLYFEISLKPNMPIINFISENGHTASLTNYTFEYEYKKDVLSIDETETMPIEMVIHYNDGASRKISSGKGNNRDFSVLSFGTSDGKGTIGGRFEVPIELDKIDNIEFAGETYKIK